jgi:hypothetical protein
LARGTVLPIRAPAPGFPRQQERAPSEEKVRAAIPELGMAKEPPTAEGGYRGRVSRRSRSRDSPNRAWVLDGPQASGQSLWKILCGRGQPVHVSLGPAGDRPADRRGQHGAREGPDTVGCCASLPRVLRRRVGYARGQGSQPRPGSIESGKIEAAHPRPSRPLAAETPLLRKRGDFRHMPRDGSGRGVGGMRRKCRDATGPLDRGRLLRACLAYRNTLLCFPNRRKWTVSLVWSYRQRTTSCPRHTST